MLPVAVRVNGDWGYTPVGASEDICSDVCSRLRLVRSEEARVKLHLGKLGDILNPQPRVAAVVHTFLLYWIYSAGEAPQRQAETPPLPRPDGTPIFPPYEKYWWLTDLEHRMRKFSRTQNMTLSTTRVSEPLLTTRGAARRTLRRLLPWTALRSETRKDFRACKQSMTHLHC